MTELKVNLENLTEEEKQTLMKLVEKSNKTSKGWKPKEGEYYWFVENDGRIYKTNCIINYWHNYRYSIGNCFQTKEKAENALERLKIRAELQRYADEYNEEIDWTARSNKWYIFYNHTNKMIDTCNVWFTNEPFQIYFSSEEIALNAIKAVGEDRIKKYLFGVE